MLNLPPNPYPEPLEDGAVVRRGRIAAHDHAIWGWVQQVAAQSPFRHMVTRSGSAMSVAMTNCGPMGWVTDRGGYRYQALDPLTRQPWPAMPAALRDLAAELAAEAGFPNFAPDACLINRYEPGSKMGLHQDRDERDLTAPIVSLSLGLTAPFLWGGATRRAPVRKIALDHGDVVVWGGPARLNFHGVGTIPAGQHPLVGACRFNLTFRQS